MRLWLTMLLLWALLTVPAVLGFTPLTYGWLKYGHFVTFILSVFLFVALGRHTPKPGKARLSVGFFAGALSGLLSSVATQYLLHLPIAEAAFRAQLPGVPASAATTMLHLHLFYSTILSAIIAGILYGILGAVATWWGGRHASVSPPPDAQSEAG